jgi:hypothetical protein
MVLGESQTLSCSSFADGDDLTFSASGTGLSYVTFNPTTKKLIFNTAIADETNKIVTITATSANTSETSSISITLYYGVSA